MRLLPFVTLLALTACGTSSSAADAGDGINAPTMQGAHAFVAQRTLDSTQTSGGGAHPGDNLSISIGNACSTLPDQEVNIELFSGDGSALTARTYTIDAGSNLVRLAYSDTRTAASRELVAVAGTINLQNVDFNAIQNVWGSYQVTLGELDGGTSSLSGTFDVRYLCH